MPTKSFKQRVLDLESVEIGWGSFSLKFKRDIANSGDKCMGLTDFDKMEILVDDSATEQVQRLTLIHEIWHVIFSTMGVRADDEDNEVNLNITNEFIVESATRGLLLFKALNPELWDLLYEQE